MMRRGEASASAIIGAKYLERWLISMTAAAAALIIYQIALRLLEHLKRQHRRPRGKIQNTVHNIPPVGSL